MRVGLAAVVAAAVLAACGDGGRPAGSPTPSGSASGTSAPVALTVESSYGALPLPTDLDTLDARLRSMPETLGAARKKPFESGYALYAGGDGEFGIEAADVEDVVRGGGTTADAFERMTAQFTGTPQSCAAPPSRCLAGRSDGQHAVMWGHDEGPILLVALGPDRSALDALLKAWKATG